jgi:Zn-dependent protease
MFRSSLSRGSVRGVPVKLHWSVLLIAALFGSGLVGQFGAVVGIVVLLTFAASILAHELAHALVARRYNVGVESIDLWALGGTTRLTGDAATPRAHGWIAAAGPLSSLAIGVVGIGASLALDAANVATNIVNAAMWVGIINVALAIFNSLPASPLDGGRVLAALRWSRHGDRFRAGREAATAGRAIGWFIIGAGIVLMVNGQNGLLLLITGMFIATGARAEQLGIDMAERVQGVRVGELTWFGVAHAKFDTDAETMLWQRSRLGEAGVVAVQSPAGEIAGFVTEDQLWAVPESRREQVLLQSLMQPLDQATKADPDDELSTVVTRLSPLNPLITVWRDGRLLGVVPRERLQRRLTAAGV